MKPRRTLIASQEGLQKIQEARVAIDKPLDDDWWTEKAAEILNQGKAADDKNRESISTATWHRFYYARKPIRPSVFRAFCAVLELDPDDIIDGTPVEGIGRPRQTYSGIQLIDQDTFIFGNIKTSWIVKDGTGEYTYERENIVCHYESKAMAFPPDIEKSIAQVTLDQEQRRQKGEKPYFFNGNRYYFDRYTITRTAFEEKPVIDLWYGPSNYYTYLATNQRLHEKKIRSKYFPKVLDQPIPFFSNAFAIYLCAITSDNYLVLTQRSQNVGSRPGEFNISANEGLSRDLDHLGDRPDLFGCALRGLKEELNVNQRNEKIKFLSFGVDALLGHWAVLGLTKTNETKADIELSRRGGVHDKWENSGIAFVPFELDLVIEYVLSVSPWAPAALACIYHTLVFEFGRDNCDAAIKRITEQ